MKNTTAEKFHELYYWQDDWFENRTGLDYTFNPEQQRVWDELRQHWAEEDKPALLDRLLQRYGLPVLSEVIDCVIATNARSEWAAMAAEQGILGLTGLVDKIWLPLRKQGFEFSIAEKDGGLQICCTKCPHAEFARQLGPEAPDLYYHVACYIDPFLVEGFNPQIGFRRTKTLMAGDAFCDHFYYPKIVS